jgi:transposase-like protein
LRGEHSIAELCRREGIAEGLYYSWSKEFLEAGKRRLAGDTARDATLPEDVLPRCDRTHSLAIDVIRITIASRAYGTAPGVANAASTSNAAC